MRRADTQTSRLAVLYSAAQHLSPPCLWRNLWPDFPVAICRASFNGIKLIGRGKGIQTPQSGLGWFTDSKGGVDWQKRLGFRDAPERRSVLEDFLFAPSGICPLLEAESLARRTLASLMIFGTQPATTYLHTDTARPSEIQPT
jgi:hypothetical protein